MTNEFTCSRINARASVTTVPPARTSITTKQNQTKRHTLVSLLNLLANL